MCPLFKKRLPLKSLCLYLLQQYHSTAEQSLGEQTWRTEMQGVWSMEKSRQTVMLFKAWTPPGTTLSLFWSVLCTASNHTRIFRIFMPHLMCFYESTKVCMGCFILYTDSLCDIRPARFAVCWLMQLVTVSKKVLGRAEQRDTSEKQHSLLGGIKQ